MRKWPGGWGKASQTDGKFPKFHLKDFSEQEEKVKPSFHKLWSEFPDHVKYPSMAELYRALGGAALRNLTVQGFGLEGNTCASRLSVAFNKAGAPIDRNITHAIGAQTLGTADGSRIIFRVADFRKYLIRSLGKPDIDKVTPYDDSFRGKKES